MINTIYSDGLLMTIKLEYLTKILNFAKNCYNHFYFQLFPFNFFALFKLYFVVHYDFTK